MATASQQYDVNQHLIETILSWVRSGEIAIPEIQRPFVWKATKVRDLLDSLYKGYPVGYLIAWKNPDIRLKDGSANGCKDEVVRREPLTSLRPRLSRYLNTKIRLSARHSPLLRSGQNSPRLKVLIRRYPLPPSRHP